MDDLEIAMSRFTTALARLERAASRLAGRDDAIRVQAAAIARLKRENEQLRTAQAEESRLRDETLAQVDRAMAAVEMALSTRASEGAEEPHLAENAALAAEALLNGMANVAASAEKITEKTETQAVVSGSSRFESAA